MSKKEFAREELREKSKTGGRQIAYEDPEEKAVLAELEKRGDFEALRLKRLLALPDLTRKANSPIKFLIERILELPDFRDFDVVKTPETVTVENAFDLFNFPADHPGRKPSDTFFIAQNRVLRTHTTSMWLYYLSDPEIRAELEERGWIGELCFGKVYRKDEIDAKHFPVFHQIDGLYICRREEKAITLKTLEDVLASIVKSVFGSKIEFRFLDDNFPFTDPSTQIEIKWSDKWLEIVGAGIVHEKVLKNFNLDPKVWNGWAFGFGLERLAMIKNNIPDIRIFWSEDPRITKQFTSIDSRYKEVSRYPEVVRDISFIVEKTTALNSFYEIVREAGGDLIEEVRLTDQFENAQKFGADKKSYTFRIVYRSHERTLTNEEVNVIHKQIEQLVERELKAQIR
ncbi:MAG TPA: hypothetical protein VJB92_00775 [Candidatus Paceibacterota bacterium]